ncbi:MAG: hypothetical protein K6E51_06970 [Treponema sp.]|nr:hypothetical protein [Treponema sp.]
MFISNYQTHVGVVPCDFRFGWQPGFAHKDSGLSFKLETGLFGQYTYTDSDHDSHSSYAAPGINLGVAYKL